VTGSASLSERRKRRRGQRGQGGCVLARDYEAYGYDGRLYGPAHSSPFKYFFLFFPQVYWQAIFKISWSHSVFNPPFLDSHDSLLSIPELRPNQPRLLATVSNLFSFSNQ